MSTFGSLKDDVARDIRDPDNKVFDPTVVGDMVRLGMAELGRVAPRRFQEDLDPVLNQFVYTILNGDFGVAVPEIELSRVELWDVTQTPHMPVKLIAPASAAYVNYSATGWLLTDGKLEMPYWVPRYIGTATANYLIRVWGYAPYVPLVNDADVVPLSYEREQALRVFCRVESLSKLTGSRAMFTQWQTRTNNTDVSMASLLSDLKDGRDEWRRLSRNIMVLREAPG